MRQCSICNKVLPNDKRDTCSKSCLREKRAKKREEEIVEAVEIENNRPCRPEEYKRYFGCRLSDNAKLLNFSDSLAY